MDGHVAMLHDFWTRMLAHLWQATLVLVPLFVFVPWLRNAPARFTHLVWSTGLLKLFLPLALFGGALGHIIRLFREVTGPASSQPANSALSVVTTVLAAPSTRFGSPAENQWPVWLLVSMTILWISGVIWLFSRLALDLHRSRKAIGEPYLSLRERTRVKLDRALNRSNVEPNRITVCKHAHLPTVVGLFKPVIVIPHKLIDCLSPDELHAVLVHEDAHRRRLDPLQSVIHRLGAALFFFYPLLWPMLRRLHETAEFVCDERAVWTGVNAKTYSRALSKTLQLGLSSVGSVSMAGGNGSLLRQRFERLTSPRRSTMSMKHRLAVAAVAVLVGVGSFWPLQMNAKYSNDTNIAPTSFPTEEKDKDKKADRKTEKTPAETKLVEAFTLEPASQPPKLVDCPPPEFPERAKQAGIGGAVTVQLLVNTNGTVDSTVVEVKDDNDYRDEFKKSVLAVIPSWRFEPAQNDKGEPVTSWVRMSVRFKLEGCTEAGYEAKDNPTDNGR